MSARRGLGVLLKNAIEFLGFMGMTVGFLSVLIGSFVFFFFVALRHHWFESIPMPILVPMCVVFAVSLLGAAVAAFRMGSKHARRRDEKGRDARGP